MTKSEKVQHKEDYKACFRAVCIDFNRGDYHLAGYSYEIIKRMCLLSECERIEQEKKILKDYNIDKSNFVERVFLMNI